MQARNGARESRRALKRIPSHADKMVSVQTICQGVADEGRNNCNAEGGRCTARPDNDEVFYVLEGEYEFMRGGHTERVGPGSTVFVPKGTVHTFRNVGSSRARALAWVVPAGFEHFFEEVGEPASDASTPPAPSDPPDLGHLIEVAQRYDLEVRMPTM